MRVYVSRWSDQWFSLEFRFTGWIARMKKGGKEMGEGGMEKLKKEMNSIRGEAIWRCFKWRSTLEILFFFSFLLPFSFLSPLPSFPLLSTFLACGPDWSSSNAISLVQRLSFGENEGVVKHLGMIYLSLDHSVPTYPYLFSLSLAIFWKKNLCPFTGSTLSIRYFFQDKSSSIKHQLLFDIDINQLAKLYCFPYIFAIFCYLVNNDFIFISKIERERGRWEKF